MLFFKKIQKDPSLLVNGYVKENCPIENPIAQLVGEYYGSPIESILDTDSSPEAQAAIVNALRNVDFYSMQSQDSDCYSLHYLFNISSRADETSSILYHLTNLLKKSNDNPAKQTVVNALQNNGIQLELKKSENQPNNQEDNGNDNNADVEDTTCKMSNCTIL